MLTFDRIWTADTADFAFQSPAEEAETIAAAKAGDSDATLRLLVVYRPVMLSVIREFAPEARRFYGNGGKAPSGVDTIDRVTRVVDGADFRSSAIEGVLAAIDAHDPAQSPSLAGIVRQYVVEAVARDAVTTTAFAIPERTLKRFFGIARRAGYDLDEGLRLAPQFEMRKETFYAIWQTVMVESTDAPADPDVEESERGDAQYRSLWDESDPYADVEDLVLVDMAFRAVDDLEEDVCRLAYGWHTYGEPVSDAEVAHRLGLSSRLKALRIRSRALDKMRDAVGA